MIAPKARRAVAASLAFAAPALLAALAVAAADSGGAAAGAGDDLGRAVFTKIANPSCTVCHALDAVGSKAEVGPSLDELRPDAERVSAAVRNGLGIMPAFRETLTDEQIKAVAAFVARATGGGK